MRCLTVLAVFVALLHGGAAWSPDRAAFLDWMASGGHPFPTHPDTPPREIAIPVLQRVARWAKEMLDDYSSTYSLLSFFGRTGGIDTRSLSEDLGRLGASKTLDEFVGHARTLTAKHRQAAEGDEEKYPYWGFLPNYRTSAVGGKGMVTWEGNCCKNNTARADWVDGKLVLKLEASECGGMCTDNYLLGAIDGARFAQLSWLKSSVQITWEESASPKAGVHYDLTTKGVRIFSFEHDMVQSLKDIVATAELFLQPFLSRTPSAEASENNVRFLSNYSHHPLMTARNNPGITGVDESLIQTGDFIGVIRLDGVDPMLAWAMGSTTGHTTVAIRAPNGTLYVAESQVKSAYWPRDGVQANEYKTWIQWAKEAGYNVAWAPMAPAVRAKLNETAMWEFFHEVEGLRYGFTNMLYGWIDEEENNYPCLPPDFKVCLTWELVEIAFAWVDSLAPSVSDLMWNQAWNIRLNTTNLTTAEIYQHAEAKGIPARKIPTIVEQDSFRYRTTQNGEAHHREGHGLLHLRLQHVEGGGALQGPGQRGELRGALEPRHLRPPHLRLLSHVGQASGGVPRRGPQEPALSAGGPLHHQPEPCERC
eukprot:Sspe_Gene.28817::Locus_13260_Transcript_1_1_Confidence_1.000_Length_2472::g.28817::m.28817